MLTELTSTLSSGSTQRSCPDAVTDEKWLRTHMDNDHHGLRLMEWNVICRGPIRIWIPTTQMTNRSTNMSTEECWRINLAIMIVNGTNPTTGYVSSESQGWFVPVEMFGDTVRGLAYYGPESESFKRQRWCRRKRRYGWRMTSIPPRSLNRSLWTRQRRERNYKHNSQW